MYVWWWQAAVQHLSPALRQPLAPTRPSPPFLIGHVPRDPGGAGGVGDRAVDLRRDQSLGPWSAA